MARFSAMERAGTSMAAWLSTHSGVKLINRKEMRGYGAPNRQWIDSGQFAGSASQFGSRCEGTTADRFGGFKRLCVPMILPSV